MADNFFRLLRLLQLVPRAPKYADTVHLESTLAREGHGSTMRTLQRDLNTLAGMGFGLECNTESKPYRWRYMEKADPVVFVSLDPQAALALRLVELHLESVLPQGTLRALQPQLVAAKKALEGKPVARWLERVRVISRSQPMIAPKVDGNIAGVVHEALLEGKTVQAKYRSKKNSSAPDAGKEMELHPLGLVHRDGGHYLVATAFDYRDPRLYPLHRFADAKMGDKKAKALPGFDLDKFIAQGELGYRISKDDIDLELAFDKEAGGALEESPLASDQTLTRTPEGRVIVKARLPDTQVLRSWILGFGSKVEVKKPKSLRAAIRETHEAAAKQYA